MTLEIDNVELYFSGKRVLGGIYLKAETGKITSLLGQNGSGKSCLLEIIFGSLKPKYGLLRIDGKPMLTPFFKTGDVGYLSQESFLPSNVKLKTIFKLYGVSWKEFKSYFTGFHVDKDSKPRSLSYGEQRLVENFIVIRGNYKALLLDEPFSHIAPIYVDKISRLIEEERDHKAIIISDHLIDEIISISDAIYLLRNGSTVKVDGKKELIGYKYLKEQSSN